MSNGIRLSQARKAKSTLAARATSFAALPLKVVAMLLTMGLIASITLPSASARESDELKPADDLSTLIQMTSKDVEESAADLVEKFERAEASLAEVTSSDAERLTTHTRDAIAQGDLLIHLPKQTKIATDRSSVLATDAGERIVFLPYVGQVVRPSGLTVVYDVAGELVGYAEAIYQPTSHNSGTVTVWQDGEAVVHAEVDASGAVKEREPDVSNLHATNADVGTMGFDWDTFGECLTEWMGVPNWVLGAISAACAAICFITAGTGCIACITGVVAGYSFEIGLCIGWAT